MMNNSNFSQEEQGEYLKNLYAHKDELNYSWEDIARKMNEKYNTNYTESKYRRQCKREFSNISLEEETNQNEQEFDLGLQLRSEIQRCKDERTQLNALYRQVSRENYLKDIAVECAKIVAEKKPFSNNVVFPLKNTKEAILLLSDWHYGIEINNHWNEYNPEICVKRLSKLAGEVGNFIDEYGIEKINILNLGDLISGRIHSQIRIDNKEDVVSQVIHVSELLSNFIDKLTVEYGVYIDYYDCLDNHSRIEPDKKESLRLESLARIITWYLQERFSGRNTVTIKFNKYSDDILSFNCRGWNVVGVHGDLDAQNRVIKNLRGMIDEKPDLVCTAHRHHFSADEENNCMMISNPSLMGTDSYAESKRLTSSPAQTLIIVTDDTPVYAIHRIVL